MKSKKALETICTICDNESCPYIHLENSRCSFYGIIKLDLNKLEELKNLEQELGVNLLTLFKALTNGVWFKEWKEPIKHTCGLKLSRTRKNDWNLENKTYCFSLKEYGKTWALTREELEND